MKSESIAKLSAALAKAQGAFKIAEKNASNPHFKSKYADLESITQAIKEPLAANELCYMQTFDVIDGKITMLTTLSHSSGEYIQSKFLLLTDRPTMQSLGSAVTYARRYSLSSLLGIVTGEGEDDGNAAEEGQKKGISKDSAAGNKKPKSDQEDDEAAVKAKIVRLLREMTNGFTNKEMIEKLNKIASKELVDKANLEGKKQILQNLMDTAVEGN